MISRLTIVAVLLLSWLPSVTVAQEQSEPIGLLADSISYDPANDALVATGNVRIIFQDQVLTTERVIFRRETNQIFLPEPLVVTSADGTTIQANSAELDPQLREGLIRGARLLLNDQFQLVSEEFSRTQGRYKVLTKVVGSTCYVCTQNPTPFWQIRSRRVVHDEFERRLYFEDSSLLLFGLPVFYTPYLSVPDPSVKRATGFLVPEISQSNTLGYGLEIPYYIVLTDHSDVTVTPFISTEESFVISAQYRQKFRNGDIKLDGAVAIADPLSTDQFRSYIRGRGAFDLRDDYKLTFGLHLASDDDFKNDYDFGDEDRLENFVRAEKTKADSYFSVGASFTQSLRANEVDQNIPLVLPEVFYRQTGREDFLGGNYGLQLGTTGLIREDGRLLRTSAQIDWTKFWRSQQGLVFGITGQVNADAYTTQNYTDPMSGDVLGSDFIGDVTPLLAAEVRYPLSKTHNGATHVIEPIAQLVWTDDDLGTNPNEDSAQAEFEDTNLFSLNRFPGLDATERGLRANIGVNYLRYDPNGWEMKATVGRVFRQKNLDQFPATVAAGLEGTVSDYVAAVALRFPNQFELVSRSLFDSDFSVSKNETLVGYRSNAFSARASYVWLDENVILNSNDSQHEIRLETGYRATENWLYTADWRHNLDDGRPIKSKFGVEYENECATVNFSLSLDYDAAGKVTREFRLKLSLEGLGNRREKRKFQRRCDV